METQLIKPCPKCGHKDVYVRLFGHYRDGKKSGYYGGCWKCGYTSPVMATREEAEGEWNARSASEGF